MSKEIDKIVDSLKKTYGSLNRADQIEESHEYISTGNKALDLSLEGGIAWGYAIEFSGFSGSGKTTIGQKMLADAQQKYNAVGIWIDRENAWYNERAESLGIDLSNVYLMSPKDLPEIEDATIFLSELLPKLPNDKYKFIMIDSISAFDDPSKINKADMGKKAQQVHRFFRKTLHHFDKKTTLCFANHRTFKIGVLYSNSQRFLHWEYLFKLAFITLG